MTRVKQNAGRGKRLGTSSNAKNGGPKGIRIPVCALKGRRPSPLDDGAASSIMAYTLSAKQKYSRIGD